jgi:hypothetical protein
VAAAAPAGWYPVADDPRRQRYWDGEKWGEKWTDEFQDLSIWDRMAGAGRAPTAPAEPTEVNVAGAALAIVGALGMFIGAFLPWVEASTFVQIQDNSLIQSGDGWVLIGCALGIGLAVYAAWRRQRQSWAVVVLAAIALGFTVYAGTGDRLEVGSVNSGARQTLGLSSTERGSPGVGIYVSGVSAGMAAVGGLLLAGIGVGAARGIPDRRTKKCPDCAETILADARVCRHCGYRFDAA